MISLGYYQEGSKKHDVQFFYYLKYFLFLAQRSFPWMSTDNANCFFAINEDFYINTGDIMSLIFQRKSLLYFSAFCVGSLGILARWWGW